MTKSRHWWAASVLAAAVAAAAVPAAGAGEAKPAVKPAGSLTGVQRAQRCMEMKNRLDEQQTKAKSGKGGKLSESARQDLDWYRKHCK